MGLFGQTVQQNGITPTGATHRHWDRLFLAVCRIFVTFWFFGVFAEQRQPRPWVLRDRGLAAAVHRLALGRQPRPSRLRSPSAIAAHPRRPLAVPIPAPGVVSVRLPGPAERAPLVERRRPEGQSRIGGTQTTGGSSSAFGSPGVIGRWCADRGRWLAEQEVRRSRSTKSKTTTTNGSLCLILTRTRRMQWPALAPRPARALTAPTERHWYRWV